MQIPILVEPLPDGRGYVAKSGEPLCVSANESTAEEAIQKVKELITDRFLRGARFELWQFPTVPVLFNKPEALPDDELTREWREAIEEYRRECDEEDRRMLAEESQAESS